MISFYYMLAVVMKATVMGKMVMLVKVMMLVLAVVGINVMVMMMDMR